MKIDYWLSTARNTQNSVRNTNKERRVMEIFWEYTRHLSCDFVQ
jgi:hypothetical protein